MVFGFLLVQVDEPLAVAPQVLAPLDDRVLGLSPNELGLQHHCSLFVTKQDLLLLLHLVVIEQKVFWFIMVEKMSG